jgi:predicted house-cleaning noncanonical NTP pyrophosphatase (MazG superfamily)
MNRELKDQLKDKAEVPDFYHRDFKRNPSQKANTYDTYSLGVLMYKLMYTEYPIFPQGRVHIPTTPQYNVRLKATLEIFLNEGGMLKDLEKKIEVSDEVAKQVKFNKKKLQQQKKEQRGRKGRFEEFDDDVEKSGEKDKKSDANTEVQEEVEDEDTEGCCKLCCAQLGDETNRHKSFMLDSL